MPRSRAASAVPALIGLARAAGVRVWVTSRDPGRGERAVAELGAHAAFPADGSLPEPVDAAMDSVGSATFGHSVRSVRPGGRIVTTGATSGGRPRSIWPGCSPGRCPSTAAPAEGRAGLERMLGGDRFGKIVIHCDR